MALIKEIISTHAPHAGSDNLHFDIIRLEPISTHAPHAGSDSGALCGGLFRL